MTDRSSNHSSDDRNDETYIQRALSLARDAAANGNTPFGSLLVHNGEVIAESENTTRTDDDLTAHPELKLARWAGRELSDEKRRETTMYTSTEPCSMCAGAIAISGLGRVVYSADSETAAEYAPGTESAPNSDLLERAEGIEVVGSVLEGKGEEVHRGFWDDDS